jgi:dihydroneopterin aldolase
LSDRIEIRGLRLLGAHGALPGEQEQAQLFEIDLDVEVDAGIPGKSDDLADALDYGTVVEIAARTVVDSHFQLLEALAEALAARVLGHGGASAVTVGVRKLRPPIAADLASVGIRIRRQAGA